MHLGKHNSKDEEMKYSMQSNWQIYDKFMSMWFLKFGPHIQFVPPIVTNWAELKRINLMIIGGISIGA